MIPSNPTTNGQHPRGQQVLELMEPIKKSLFFYLRGIFGDEHDAEDALQDVYVILLRGGIERYDSGRPFRNWIYTVASHRANDTLRKRKDRVGLNTATDLGDADFDILRYLPDRRTRTVEESVELDEGGRALREDLDGLPDQLREVARYRYFFELSYEQIARTANIPLGTVKSRLHSVHSVMGKLAKRRDAAYS